jgi:hypothetical protein
MSAKPKTLRELITQERETLAELAAENMRLPKTDPFEHGVQVGRWQGVETFLNRIEEMLKTKESD